eukprot:2883076-Amphidinium_carterae.1
MLSSYERIHSRKVGEFLSFALESGYPLHAHYVAVDNVVYSGRRRVLIQGAVNQTVTATHGMPPGCGHPVDLLHSLLLNTLQSAGHISAR